MSFGKAGTMHDWTLDEKASEDVIKHALSQGINFFNPANGYSEGTGTQQRVACPGSAGRL